MTSAIDFFAARLRWQMDPADLAAERSSGNRRLVVDVRDEAAWQQGHLPGAVHVPRPELSTRIGDAVHDPSTPIVVYCWGPGCNGSTKAALDLARLGYTDVKELVGGFEYWAREGLAIEGADGRWRRPVDELTAPRTRPESR